MNELQQKLTSVDVAEMVDKDHSKLLRDIRTYCEQLGEANIGLSEFFQESTYQSEQNKILPCYLVTKKGCEFIANKLTGTKGAIFTAKYINKFNDMQEALIGQVYQVPQSLLALQGMVEQMIRQEISIKEANDMSKKALETTQAIKEAIISESDDWRNDIKHKVSTIQKSMNKGYQEVWTELYDELEKRGHCDLSVRVNNGRYRLENSGATKTTINNYGRLDVIEADVRLKEIFSAIVKEYTVKCVN